MPDKPLFIPLRGEYFKAFRDGRKTVELRRYGPRWNQGTCKTGREVILSHGYSGDRIRGTIRGARFMRAADLAASERRDFADVYGTADIDVTRIEIRIARDPARAETLMQTLRET